MGIRGTEIGTGVAIIATKPEEVAVSDMTKEDLIALASKVEQEKSVREALEKELWLEKFEELSFCSLVNTETKERRGEYASIKEALGDKKDGEQIVVFKGSLKLRIKG